jgi:hypothetical protein
MESRFDLLEASCVGPYGISKSIAILHRGNVFMANILSTGVYLCHALGEHNNPGGGVWKLFRPNGVLQQFRRGWPPSGRDAQPFYRSPAMLKSNLLAERY